MKIVVENDHILVDDIESFKKFYVELNTNLEIARALFSRYQVGFIVDQNSAEIRINFIQQQAGHLSKTEVWLNQFNKMLEFAEQHNWLSADKSSIFAHIEFISDSKF